MQCSEMHIIDDERVPVFTCRSPASIVAREYKSSSARGLCTHCFKKILQEDYDSFLDRHELTEVE